MSVFVQLDFGWVSSFVTFKQLSNVFMGVGGGGNEGCLVFFLFLLAFLFVFYLVRVYAMCALFWRLLVSSTN